MTNEEERKGTLFHTSPEGTAPTSGPQLIAGAARAAAHCQLGTQPWS